MKHAVTNEAIERVLKELDLFHDVSSSSPPIVRLPNPSAIPVTTTTSFGLKDLQSLESLQPSYTSTSSTSDYTPSESSSSLSITQLIQDLATQAMAAAPPVVVSTPKAVSDLITKIYQLQDIQKAINKLSEPFLYVDVEGTNFGRNGKVSLIVLYIKASGHGVTLVDAHTLGSLAFTTKGSGMRAGDKTLKSILEDVNITKIFWDARTDAETFFFGHQIRLAGVQDIQVMEGAARLFHTTMKNGKMQLMDAVVDVGGRQRCIGLGEAIDLFAPLPTEEKADALNVKKAGRALLDERGDAVFNERPLSQEIIDYSAGDVVHLDTLRAKFLGIIDTFADPEEAKKIVAETGTRRINKLLDAKTSRGDFEKKLLGFSDADHEKLDAFVETKMDALKGEFEEIRNLIGSPDMTFLFWYLNFRVRSGSP